jgi:hypothetical protein
MSTVFGEYDRPPPCESSAEHRLKERRALMSMQDFSSLTIRKLSQARGTTAVDAGLPMQMLDDKSVFQKTHTDFTDFIEHSHNAAKVFLHAANHLIHQNLRTANSQRVDDVADRRTIVNRDDSKLSWGGLNHG